MNNIFNWAMFQEIIAPILGNINDSLAHTHRIQTKMEIV